MHLQQLLAGISDTSFISTVPPYTLIDTIEVTSIAYDSRRVHAGTVFFAIHGFHVDGNAFILQAIRQGAAALVSELPYPVEMSLPVPYIQVKDVRRALAECASILYGQPGKHMCVFGVTGTDGKTTTSGLLHEILSTAQRKALLMTTTELRMGRTIISNESRQSTLEATEVQSFLAEGQRFGVSHAILETTSHGLALEKVRGCYFDVGIITNITRDHLDFHKTLENYRKSKAKLFEMLGEITKQEEHTHPCAILNRDDSSFGYLQPLCSVPILSYGIHEYADIRAIDITVAGRGSTFRILFPDSEIQIQTALIGMFNVSNCLAAAAAAYSQGVAIQDIATALSRTHGMKGRMERIDNGQPFTLIVDYAHTPEGLTQVLRTARDMVPGKVLLVFGSAGERDVEKRPIMGKIAAEMADFCIITNEDPRSEDPLQIMHDIAQGVLQTGKREGVDFLIISDRAEAIREACRRAAPEDIVLLTGKGHEHCIIAGTEKIPWNEAEAASIAVHALGYGE